MRFQFEIGSTVLIMTGNFQGEVVGRAEYANAESSYLLRYLTPHGPTEQWWGESALKGV